MRCIIRGSRVVFRSAVCLLIIARVVTFSLRPRTPVLVSISVSVPILVTVAVLPGIRIIRVALLSRRSICTRSLSVPRVVAVLVISVLIISIGSTRLSIALTTSLPSLVLALTLSLRSTILILISAATPSTSLSTSRGSHH